MTNGRSLVSQSTSREGSVAGATLQALYREALGQAAPFKVFHQCCCRGRSRSPGGRTRSPHSAIRGSVSPLRGSPPISRQSSPARTPGGSPRGRQQLALPGSGHVNNSQASVYDVEETDDIKELRKRPWHERIQMLTERTCVCSRKEWEEQQLPDLLGDKHDTGLAATCCLCMCDIAPDEQIRGLACGHAFHVGCLAQWFIRDPLHVTCPLCRVPLRDQQAIDWTKGGTFVPAPPKAPAALPSAQLSRSDYSARPRLPSADRPPRAPPSSQKVGTQTPPAMQRRRLESL